MIFILVVNNCENLEVIIGVKNLNCRGRPFTWHQDLFSHEAVTSRSAAHAVENPMHKMNNPLIWNPYVVETFFGQTFSVTQNK
jgi:hypothetical protein